MKALTFHITLNFGGCGLGCVGVWCTVTVGFLSQRACNVDRVSMLWRHNYLSWRQHLPRAHSCGSFNQNVHLRGLTITGINPETVQWGMPIMTTRCAPACSQALPVKPQGVWAIGNEAWVRSHDLRIWGCRGGGLRALQPNVLCCRHKAPHPIRWAPFPNRKVPIQTRPLL